MDITSGFARNAPRFAQKSKPPASKRKKPRLTETPICGKSNRHSAKPATRPLARERNEMPRKKKWILSRNGEYIGRFCVWQDAEDARKIERAQLEKFERDGWIKSASSFRLDIF